jgi:copper resistance protein D
MIEIIATFARWSQLSANLVLFGSCIFFAIVGQQKAVFEAPWVKRLEKGFLWMAGLVILGLIGFLATTVSEATGVASDTWRPAAWLEFVQKTQVGLIFAVQILLAIVLFGVVLYVLRANRTRWHYLVSAVAASLPLIAGTFISHSSADEMSFASIAPFALHILLAGIWFGALPAFLFIVYSTHRESDKALRLLNVTYLEKFSAIALPVMLLLAVTGLIVTDRMVEDYYHTLVASSYGWLLIFKLVVLTVILFIAYQARYKWLPLLPQAEDKKHGESTAHLKKWVSIEFFLALVLILIASILANTLPAKHAIIDHWPFPFRFSTDDTTLEEANIEEMLWAGVMLFIFALGVIWFSIKHNWSWKKKILVPGALTITSLAIALPPIAIEAYPETYLKPTIPLDAISISHGSHLFAEHCISCHGPQGKGNGPFADTLSTKPTDLLTEPHTARQTVGNFFHWISNGVPGTNMPGFSANLIEEDRWDIVNFLHALSRGFDARLLGSMILPETPAIAAPVFYYSASDVSGGDLKDFRLEKNVILVLFSWPQSQQRLNQLKHAYERLTLNHNAEILAVPMRELDEQELLDITDSVPFPVVTEGWSEIRDTYLLYRRVRAVPDLSGEGMTPDHIEFMIDRFGYLRARWVARFEGFGWQNVNALTFQLDQLNQEDEIMPPPDDHAH